MPLTLGTGSANTAASAVRVGTGSSNVAATKVMAGTGSDCVQVWPIALASAGMDKSGTQTLDRNVDTKVTGWTPRSGYAGTTIATDGIVVTGSGTVTVHAQVQWGGGNSVAASQLRILRNGVEAAVFTSSGSHNSLAGSASLALTQGDVLTFHALRDHSITNYRTVQAGGTFMYFDAP